LDKFEDKSLIAGYAADIEFTTSTINEPDFWQKNPAPGSAPESGFSVDGQMVTFQLS